MASARPTRPLDVLIVGGPDVDARIELMDRLGERYRPAAAGTGAGLSARFAAAGYDYHHYRLTRRFNPVADLLSFLALFQMVRRIRPDIVHTFDTKPSVIARLAAGAARAPIVVGTIPGLGSLYADDRRVTRLMRGIYEPVQRWACRMADLTIFQNPDDEARFLEHGLIDYTKTAVIPGSGICTDHWSPGAVSRAEVRALRRELAISPNDTVVVMVSRLLRSKGVMHFVEAADDVRRSEPATTFVLVGPRDFESRDALSNDELRHVERIVRWTGPRSDVRTILAASDIFVLPTCYPEGVPRVLLEAAAMSLPIVATDAPGCRSVVEDGSSGLLVPPHDTPALATSIRCLIEEPSLARRLGMEARRRICAEFDIQRVAELTADHYEALSGGRREPAR